MANIHKLNYLYLTKTVSTIKLDSALLQLESYIKTNSYTNNTNTNVSARSLSLTSPILHNVSARSLSLTSPILHNVSARSLSLTSPILQFASTKTKLQVEPVCEILNTIPINLTTNNAFDKFLIDDPSLFNYIVYYITYFCYCYPFKFFDETGSETSYLNMQSAVDNYLDNYTTKFLESLHKNSLSEVSQEKKNKFYEVVLGNKSVIDFRDEFLSKTPYLLDDNYTTQSQLTREEIKGYVDEVTMKVIELINKHNKYNKIISYINQQTKQQTKNITEVNRYNLMCWTEMILLNLVNSTVITNPTSNSFQLVPSLNSKINKGFSKADLKTRLFISFLSNYIDNSDNNDMFSSEESKMKNIRISNNTSTIDPTFVNQLYKLFNIPKETPRATSKNNILNLVLDVYNNTSINLTTLVDFIVDSWVSYQFTQNEDYKKLVREQQTLFNRIMSTAKSIQVAYVVGNDDESDKLSLVGPDVYNKFININPITRAIDYIRVTLGTSPELEQLYYATINFNEPTAMNILNTTNNENTFKDILLMHEKVDSKLLTDNIVKLLMKYRLTQTQALYSNNKLHTRELAFVDNELVPTEKVNDKFKLKLASNVSNSMNTNIPCNTISLPVYKYVSSFEPTSIIIPKPNGCNVGVITTDEITVLIYTKNDYVNGFESYW